MAEFYEVNPDSLNLPDCNINEHMVLCSKPYSDLVAIEYMVKKISYKQMYAKINDVAKAMKMAGVKKGDIVSVCLPNIPEVVYVFYAINRIGATANMLDPRSSESDLQTELQEANSELLVSLDSVYAKFAKIIQYTVVKQIIVVSAISSFSVLKQKIICALKPELNIL